MVDCEAVGRGLVRATFKAAAAETVLENTDLVELGSDYSIAVILTARLLGNIVWPCSQISEENLSRPLPTAPRPACCAPRRPRGIGSWSRETLYHNSVTRSIPAIDLLEGIETVTELWYNNNKWP